MHKERRYLNDIIQQKDYIFQSIIDSINQTTVLTRAKFPYNKQLTSSFFTFKSDVKPCMYINASVKDNSLIIPIETYLKTRQAGNVAETPTEIAKVKILIAFDKNNNISHVYDDLDILTTKNSNYSDVLDYVLNCLDQADAVILGLFKRRISSCDQTKYEEDMTEIKQIIEINKGLAQI